MRVSVLLSLLVLGCGNGSGGGSGPVATDGAPMLIEAASAPSSPDSAPPPATGSDGGTIGSLFPAGLPPGCSIDDAAVNDTCEPLADTTSQSDLGFSPAWVCCQAADDGASSAEASVAVTDGGRDGESDAEGDGGVRDSGSDVQ
jgi:hypothetical protein